MLLCLTVIAAADDDGDDDDVCFSSSSRRPSSSSDTVLLTAANGNKPQLVRTGTVFMSFLGVLATTAVQLSCRSAAGETPRGGKHKNSVKNKQKQLPETLC